MNKRLDYLESLSGSHPPHVSMQTIVNYKLLSTSPIFSNINKETLINMLQKMQRDRWPRGYHFICSEQTNTRFYILIKGRLKVSRQHSNNGRELTLFVLGPGDGFNIFKLIDGSSHNLQINTLDEVEILSAPVSQWNAWLKNTPELRKNLVDIGANQIEKLSNLACELALEDTMARLIHLLERYFNHATYGVDLINDLPQEELAHMIGTVRPVLSRLMNKLKREGLIDVHDGELHIHNLQSLLDKLNNHPEYPTQH